MNNVDEKTLCGNAANYGGWEVRKWSGDAWPDKRISISDGFEAVAINPRYSSASVAMRNFEFIAHFNPQRVMQLLERIDELEDDVAGLVAAVDSLSVY